jgi:hypothetical protein
MGSTLQLISNDMRPFNATANVHDVLYRARVPISLAIYDGCSLWSHELASEAKNSEQNTANCNKKKPFETPSTTPYLAAATTDRSGYFQGRYSLHTVGGEMGVTSEECLKHRGPRLVCRRYPMSVLGDLKSQLRLTFNNHVRSRPDVRASKRLLH